MTRETGTRVPLMTGCPPRTFGLLSIISGIVLVKGFFFVLFPKKYKNSLQMLVYLIYESCGVNWECTFEK